MVFIFHSLQCHQSMADWNSSVLSKISGWIFTQSVLIDGHVQHTDKTCKKSYISIKYGLNKFQFNKLFFRFYNMYKLFCPVFIPRCCMSERNYNQQSVPASTINGTCYSAHQTGYCTVMHPSGKTYAYEVFLSINMIVHSPA